MSDEWEQMCGGSWEDEHAAKERARAAALGQSEWGTWGSVDHHRRYVEPIGPRSRRRCNCGCGKRATHVGCVNGLGMTSGCELSMRRWAR